MSVLSKKPSTRSLRPQSVTWRSVSIGARYSRRSSPGRSARAPASSSRGAGAASSTSARRASSSIREVSRSPWRSVLRVPWAIPPGIVPGGAKLSDGGPRKQRLELDDELRPVGRADDVLGLADVLVPGKADRGDGDLAVHGA